MGAAETAVECPACKRDCDLADWLDHGYGASPPVHKWLWSRCPACGGDGAFTLSTGHVTIGGVDGFPGPAFIPHRGYRVPALRVRWQEDRLVVGLGGRRWTFRRGPYRGG